MFDLKKTEIKPIEESSTHGVFEISPLPPGYGYTIGVPLRRILLSSIEGAAITEVKIKGVLHEFSTLPGVKDDILRILLKLKRVVVISYSDKPQLLTLNVKGAAKKEREVTAGDIKTTESTEIFNKDFVITSLTSSKGELKMELTVEKGTGYRLADDEKRTRIGVIPLDACFSPVERVRMDVSKTRVGQQTDLDRLILEIWTKGNVSPAAALQKAVEIARDSFDIVFSKLGGTSLEEEKNDTKKGSKERLVCPKCSKVYTAKAYFDKHVKKCKG